MPVINIFKHHLPFQAILLKLQHQWWFPYEDYHLLFTLEFVQETSDFITYDNFSWEKWTIICHKDPHVTLLLHQYIWYSMLEDIINNQILTDGMTTTAGSPSFAAMISIIWQQSEHVTSCTCLSLPSFHSIASCRLHELFPVIHDHQWICDATQNTSNQDTACSIYTARSIYSVSSVNLRNH